jgi:hypothetical protein
MNDKLTTDNYELTIDNNDLTRDQAVAQAGLEAVNILNEIDCDFTNRLLRNGWVEFCADMEIPGETESDCERIITAYYYQKEEDVKKVEDLGDLNWEVHHYSIF